MVFFLKTAWQDSEKEKKISRGSNLSEVWDVKGLLQCVCKRKEREKKDTLKNRKETGPAIEGHKRFFWMLHWHYIFITSRCLLFLWNLLWVVFVHSSQQHLVAGPQMFNNIKIYLGSCQPFFLGHRNPAPVSKGCLFVKCRAIGNFPTKAFSLLSQALQ